ncbi:protein hsr-9-like isoform X2 [Paramacrobiotus metropolitanus]|uniref:protein hsr-9-like isoform X2 n=1 Tax=Paramacrobiotus metropolitanus TaxID=2943436 RepID=UPI002445F005|nr:protein hsr-9-like isoform X2 [Paramacrobiotus metropolitanus]
MADSTVISEVSSMISEDGSPSHDYSPGTYVFGLCNGDKRCRYSVTWCEDKTHALLAPQEIRLPKDILGEGLLVHLISQQQQQFYEDAVITHVGDENSHTCRTLKGAIIQVHIKDIMIKGSKLNKFLQRRQNSAAHQNHTRTEARDPGFSKRSVSVLSSEERTESSPKRPVNNTSTDPNLLAGYTLIITQANRIPSWKKRDQLIGKIVTMGGKIVNNVSDFLEDTGEKLLIAPEFLRTVKYLQCLAASIPCISEKWVDAVYNSNHLFDYTQFLLPAGIARPSGELVGWQSCSIPLEGMQIGLCGERWFNDMYTETLKVSKSGAVAVVLDEKNQFQNIKSCTLILMDENEAKDELSLRKILDAAKSAGLAVLGSEWLIQCIIQKRAVDFQPFVFSD